ncbi:bifunctional diaminohydroxyphosphoribosylaminopyrimidine deaminase/5-amino-6-(5-phosphoribosylamino)uracil reductase RibD [Litoribacillus peritrichatus]|uniref:Riboflavin biosynthesis protein RibD n=1 Tax=Litoribacillus peritrichatus TaxID=718191 RepID=A0ABP7M1F2_9GAMM
MAHSEFNSDSEFNSELKFTSEDRQWMQRAIELAREGWYTTHPNPRVGCVIVKDQEVVGEGFHYRAGEPHAEVHAIRDAGEKAQGATAYVTLEPCSHFGRTPPCCDGLIAAGVSRVVAAMEDPNPQVAGKGLARIQAAGIDVASGLLEAEARALNPGFLKRMEHKLPYVRVKQAMSLDGRTAMASGESKWITGADARSDVQRLRAQSGAIITGVASVIHDDSSLTVRKDELGLADTLSNDIVAKQPIRVVLDTHLSIPETAKLLGLDGKTIIVCSNALNAEQEHKANFLAEKATVIKAPLVEGRIDLGWLLTVLADTHEVCDVLVEAGATLCGQFLALDLVDEYWVYVAPKLMGAQARPLVDLGYSTMSQALNFEFEDAVMLGRDLRLIARPVKSDADNTAAGK